MKVVEATNAMSKKEEESSNGTKPFKMKIINRFKVDLEMVYQSMKCQ